MSDGFRRVVRAMRIDDERRQLEAELRKMSKDDLVALIMSGELSLFRVCLEDVRLWRLRRVADAKSAAADRAWKAYESLPKPSDERGFQEWNAAFDASCRADDRRRQAHDQLVAEYERRRQARERAPGVPASSPSSQPDREEPG